MASAIEKVIEIAANNLFDNASVQTCLTAVTDLSNNIDTRVNVIIDGAPGTLDTLNELAAALGDDANYATSVATTLATKAVKGSDVSFNDISANDISANDVSGVNFFTTGGSFIGNLVGDVSGNTISAQNYAVGTTNCISASRQGNFRDLEVKDNNNVQTIQMDGTGGNVRFDGTLRVDTINEKTDASGVTIEQVLLKDNNVTADTVTAQNYAVGSTNFISASRQGNFRDLEVKSGSNNLTVLVTGDSGDMSLEGTLTVDTINEKTSTAGVTIDGVLLKDGGATFTGDVSGNDASFNDVSGVNFFGNLVGNVTGNVTGSSGTCTGTAATVTGAAQTAITSVGTLLGLVVSGDLSGNDASFNDVSGVNFFGNLVGNVTGNVTGSSGSCTGNAATATTATNVDLSTKEVKDLSDVSYNTVTSGQVLSWNTDGYFEPVTQTAAGLNVNSDISINELDANDISCNTLRTSGTMALGGHIIPTANAAYDLGSAEYKIRHLFLSDNSLWIGDNHKIDISGGKMKFKKRKSNTVPQEILDASGGSTAQDHSGAIIEKFGFYDISQVKLHHWHEYVLDTAASGVTNLLPHQLFQKTANFETDREANEAVQLPTKSGGAPTTTAAVGTMIFNTDDNKLYIYNGGWKSVQLN